MKRFIIFSCVVLFLLGMLLYLIYFRGFYLEFGPDVPVTASFRTEGKQLQHQLEDGTWETLVLRGVDISSSLPGKEAQAFAPEYEDYLRWLDQIHQMGANTIRVFTVMDGDFYRALYEYNTTQPDPLYLLQGLTIPDQANYGAGDLYQEDALDLLLENGIKAVDVIHGKRIIELGRHTGTGWYHWDLSPWTLGYLLGHEWDSGLIAYTNNSTQGPTSYQGTYFQTGPEASRFETAMASVMDRILAYESDKYHQQRLISFISSPWDDPFAYRTVYNARFSTYNQVNIEHILPTQELKSGYFASYRLSSLCPDYQHYFTPEQQAALGELLAGLEDADRYSGYLTLLNRYHTLPVLAIGYGFSTARAPITENQPPQNEQEQGQALVERWQDLREAGWAGAFVSTWQDVWDRRSWNTAYTTYHNGVVPWQDVQTDGQCYGLMAFEPGEAETVCQVDGTPDEWTAEDQVLTAQGLSLSMKYDEKYLYFYVDGIQPEEDTLYLPIDTTPKSGSTYCQEHRLSFTRGCDFLIAISGEHNSRVLVQERYEHLWAMYSYETAQENAYLAGKQRAKDSPAFRPIRRLLQQEEPQTLTTWDAMPTYETGRLTYGNANPDAPDFDSLADYCFTDHGVELRIPWQLLNFSNPSEMMIHDDYYECYGVENLHIEEMYVGAAVADDSGARIPMTAFPLEGWGKTVTYHERLKESYYILQAYWRQEEA